MKGRSRGANFSEAINHAKQKRPMTASFEAKDEVFVFLAQCLHHLVDRPVQIFIRPALLIDLGDGMHHRCVVLTAELTTNLR